VTLLNGVEVDGFLTMRTFLMKVIGAVTAVAASLPLGYQGVMLHIGGMIANGLASVLPHFELSRVRAPPTLRRVSAAMQLAARRQRAASNASVSLGKRTCSNFLLQNASQAHTDTFTDAITAARACRARSASCVRARRAGTACRTSAAPLQATPTTSRRSAARPRCRAASGASGCRSS
jgi:Voltage gated chloride channel